MRTYVTDMRISEKKFAQKIFNKFFVQFGRFNYFKRKIELVYLMPRLIHIWNRHFFQQKNQFILKNSFHINVEFPHQVIHGDILNKFTTGYDVYQKKVSQIGFVKSIYLTNYTLTGTPLREFAVPQDSYKTIKNTSYLQFEEKKINNFINIPIVKSELTNLKSIVADKNRIQLGKGTFSTFIHRFISPILHLQKSEVETRSTLIASALDSTMAHVYPSTRLVLNEYPIKTIETKERTIEKEQLHQKQNVQDRLNLNRLADQVYQLIERKIRIEKERRGLW